MKICFSELMLEISRALDCVERDLLGVKTNHGKRVAYICTLLGREFGLKEQDILDLAACAVLHDNALTEYIQEEYLNKESAETQGEKPKVGIHCSLGERNVKDFPFYGDTKFAILYHHENADGTGPFGKKTGEIPFYAALIHLADQLDTRFSLHNVDEKRFLLLTDFMEKNRRILFADLETDLFLNHIGFERLQEMTNDRIDLSLKRELRCLEEEFNPEQLMNIAGIIARIVDYKSTFTSSHSTGIANKAYKMASYYRLDDETRAKLFLTGAFHDIGKLEIDVNILEKPGKLTEDEFVHMKNHALITWEILSRVHGMEDICRWASHHHEKLNGKGYPFGYDETKLGRYERLIACLDIYQALREERPYKKGMTHRETIKILSGMARDHWIDGNIIMDIDQVFAENEEEIYTDKRVEEVSY